MQFLKRLFYAWFWISAALVALTILFPSTAGESIKQAIPEPFLDVLLLPAGFVVVVALVFLILGAIVNNME